MIKQQQHTLTSHKTHLVMQQLHKLAVAHGGRVPLQPVEPKLPELKAVKLRTHLFHTQLLNKLHHKHC